MTDKEKLKKTFDELDIVYHDDTCENLGGNGFYSTGLKIDSSHIYVYGNVIFCFGKDEQFLGINQRLPRTFFSFPNPSSCRQESRHVREIRGRVWS